MRDVSFKVNTLRSAIAVAIVKADPATIEVVKDNRGPKPDILPTARAAAFLAVKNTPHVLPHCHPIPIEHCMVDFAIESGSITISVTVTTICKTGVEMEALHGASIAALTIYDMLKPLDKDIEIAGIRLEEKRGGKSDFPTEAPAGLKAAVIVCSDSISKGKKEDKAGKAILTRLQKWNVNDTSYVIIPDEVERIRECVLGYVGNGVELIITTGGTGLGPRDVTTEALGPLLDREIPGIMEAARHYGQERTPYSMLSRGIAGLIGRSLVLCLPGSTNGAKESMDALFPSAFHLFKVLEAGYRHEDMRRNSEG